MRAASSGVRPSSSRAGRRHSRRERTPRISRRRIVSQARRCRTERVLAVDRRSCAARSRACSSGDVARDAVDRADLAGASTTVARPDDDRRPPRRADHRTTATPRRPTAADLAAVRVRLQPVVTGLSSPVAVVFRPRTSSPTGAMYVVEQTGTLRLVAQRARASPTPALDLRANLSHGNEQGFLGVAFSPDGSAALRRATPIRNGDTNVDEYAMRGAVADPGDAPPACFFAQQPYSNHNGGEVIVRARRHALHRARRRRQRGRPAQQRPEPRARRSRRSCASIPTPIGARAVQRSRRQPVRRAQGRACPRPGCGACATRGDSRSTARPATCGSATSARTSTRRSTSRRAGEKGINWGWSRARGLPRVQGRAPGRRARSDRRGAARRRLLRDRRRLRVPRPRDPGARRRVPLRRRLPARHRRRSSQRGGHVDRATRPRDRRSPSLTTFGEDGTGELYVASRAAAPSTDSSPAELVASVSARRA